MSSQRLRSFFAFPLALGSILAILVFILAGRGVGDTDLWWHLRNAQYLFSHLQLPRVDMYSYTAQGYPWVAHEWLSEIPYYLAWRAFGLLGLYALFLFLVELMIFGVFYLSTKESGNVKGAFLASCYAAFLAAVTYGPRTILFGYIYLLILLWLLRRFRSTGQAPLWILPPLFCLWINTHGSWSLGLIVFAIIFASGLVEGQCGRVVAARWTPQQLRQLVISGVASLGALFVNPYGYRLVTYPFDLAFRQKLNVQYGVEWASVDFNGPRGKIVFVGLFGLLLFAVLSRYQWKLEELGLAFFAVYTGLAHVRFLCLAAILLIPLLAKGFDFIPPYRPEIDKPLLNAVVFFGILTIIVFRFPSQAILEKDLDGKFPRGALTFINAHGLSGNLFNQYEWGGYLGWNQPQLKVFIDTRTDIFEYAGVLKDYIGVIRFTDTFGVLDKYQIRYVLMPPTAPVSYTLEHNQGWNTLYKDKTAILFERAGPGSSPAQAGKAP